MVNFFSIKYWNFLQKHLTFSSQFRAKLGAKMYTTYLILSGMFRQPAPQQNPYGWIPFIPGKAPINSGRNLVHFVQHKTETSQGTDTATLQPSPDLTASLHWFQQQRNEISSETTAEQWNQIQTCAESDSDPHLCNTCWADLARDIS